MTDQNTDTTFDNQVGMWAEKIPSIEKATTKRIYQFALFMILGGLIVTALLFAGFLYYAIGLLIYTIAAIVGFVVMKRRNKVSEQELLDEIRQRCEPPGWGKALVIEALVERLPDSKLCSDLVKKLDSETALSARMKVEASRQERISRTSAPLSYDQLEYREIPVSGTQVVVPCPVCEAINNLSTANFVSNDPKIRSTGQILRLSSPISKWAGVVVVTILVFLIARMMGVELAMSCSAAVAIGLLGGFWILKPVVESIFGSLFAKKIPIWEYSCRDCGTNIPIASDGEHFMVGNIQSKNEPGQNNIPQEPGDDSSA